MTPPSPLARAGPHRWDSAAHQWVLQKGAFEVSVGAASDDIKLSGVMHVA